MCCHLPRVLSKPGESGRGRRQPQRRGHRRVDRRLVQEPVTGEPGRGHDHDGRGEPRAGPESALRPAAAPPSRRGGLAVRRSQRAAEIGVVVRVRVLGWPARERLRRFASRREAPDRRPPAGPVGPAPAGTRPGGGAQRPGSRAAARAQEPAGRRCREAGPAGRRCPGRSAGCGPVPGTEDPLGAAPGRAACRGPEPGGPRGRAAPPVPGPVRRAGPGTGRSGPVFSGPLLSGTRGRRRLPATARAADGAYPRPNGSVLRPGDP